MGSCKISRDKRIDILRFAGLSAIILAHADIPGILHQLRSYAVPLMVLVSGLSFVRSRKNLGYTHYLWKRIRRLALPGWIFLVIYFALDFLLKFAPGDLNFETIILSFSFLGGIGYVWIIGVFVFVAFAAPLLSCVSSKIDSRWKYLSVLVVLWLFYEVCVFFYRKYSEDTYVELLGLFVLQGIGYSLILGFGIGLERFLKKEICIMCLLFLLIFAMLCVGFYISHGKVVPTLYYKYPPQLYYLSYSLFVSLFLWLIADKLVRMIELFPIVERVVMFIAQNSIWIYLWHILAIKMVDAYIPLNFVLTYMVIYSFGVIMAFLQVSFVTRVLMVRAKEENIKYNLRLILTG